MHTHTAVPIPPTDSADEYGLRAADTAPCAPGRFCSHGCAWSGLRALAGCRIEGAIQAALREAERRNIRGPAVTPFLLNAVNVLTHGASLRANIALIKNNARRGSEIALALHQQAVAERMAGPSPNVAVRSAGPPAGPTPDTKASPAPAWRDTPKARPLVVGGAVMDITAQIGVRLPTVTSSSHPGTVRQSSGGVGRNVAEAMARMGTPPRFITVVGADDSGAKLAKGCERARHATMETRPCR